MTWTLRTARSEYVLGEAPDGAGLMLEHWGEPGRHVPSVPAGSSSFEADLDAAPLELTALGTRHVHGVELVMRRPGGVAGVRLRLADPVVLNDDGTRQHLVARLADDDAEVAVTLHVVADRRHDVVEKWAVVENLSPTAELHLARAFSAAWCLPVGPGARVDALVGAWSREFTPVTVDLPAGSFSIGSRQGITSHTYSPVVAVSPRSAGEGRGAYGIALAWSGSWRLAVDAVPFGDHVRVSGGVDDESQVIRLEPGARFEAPAMQGLWSPLGPDDLAQGWHRYQRDVLARSLGPEHRPVVYNSWYATGFDVRADHQLALADVAAELGAEVFVVDDGWFRGRDSDTAGLGDWWPDDAAFPGGLGPLASGVIDRGMRFGLWVEPEAVNPDSDLFRAHPEWVYRAGDRPLTTLRHQYLLDLGRPDVERWATDMLRRVLGELPITYLKWDMNRAVSDGGRPGDPDGLAWSWQHTEAYYRILRVLRTEFGHVTLEACAGGGGRIDNAVLALCDVVWPSDETGPRDRLAIQHGFLSAYPPSVMSSWVTDEPDRLDPAAASLEFRFVVAMAGVLGIGADVLAWDAETRALGRRLVALYVSVRDVVQRGTVLRRGLPSDDRYAVQYTHPSDGRVVVLAWARPGRGAEPLRVRLGGLDPDARLRVAGSSEDLMGKKLATDGLAVGFALAADCDVVVLEPVLSP